MSKPPGSLGKEHSGLRGQGTPSLRRQHAWVSLRSSKEAGWLESRDREGMRTLTGRIVPVYGDGATGLRHVGFKMLVRHPSGGDMARRVLSLKSRSKDMGVDINVGIISI